MRSLEKIQTEIAEKNTSIDEIQGQIDDAEEILSKKKLEYSQALLAKADPETLAEHRNAIHNDGIELDGLKGVSEILESELLELEGEATAAQLFNRDVERHTTAMADVEKAVTAINEGLPQLQILVEELSAAIKTCFTGTAAACSSLSSLPNELDQAFSLESFLSGQLEASTDDEEREALLDAIGQDLQQTICALKTPETVINLTALQHLIEQAHKWRSIVESFPTGAALIRNRKVLVPQLSRRPTTERITVPHVPRSSHAARMDIKPMPQFNRNKPKGRQFVGNRESL